MDVGALSLVVIGGVGAAYSYFLYPIVLFFFRDVSASSSKNAPTTPKLTLIIAARNEERRIRAKIVESIALRDHYPNLDILVASDASTDATDDITREFGGKHVQLVRTNAHNGKEYAQQAAIAAAGGDIIVFTDTGTTITPESIPRIVELFSDPSIGAVSSTDRFIDNDGNVSGEGLYIRYEMGLRELESRKGGLVGLSGSFFAARKAVCSMWDTDVPSDFAVAINSRLMGLRAISDRDVIGLYRDSSDPQHEFARKVRTVIRGMSTLAKKSEALNPLRFGRFAFQLWSHKVLRYAVPWFALVYVAGVAILLPNNQGFGLILLAPIAMLACLAAVGAALPALRAKSIVSAAHYFVQVNAAVLIAGIQFIGGKRVKVWTPTQR